MPRFDRERKVGGLVAGIDEVGRGPLAGPVYAAAVILNPKRLPKGIDDSKALTAAQREDAYAHIMGCALAVGIGSCDVNEIDALNILQATMLAMHRAVDALAIVPSHALVDGNRLPHLPCPGHAIIGGDGKVLSIAAASIIAKVTRDRVMCELDGHYPGYLWARNKGYGTADHLDALRRLGPTIHHRTSFAPVANMMR